MRTYFFPPTKQGAIVRYAKYASSFKSWSMWLFAKASKPLQNIFGWLQTNAYSTQMVSATENPKPILEICIM